MAHTTNQQLVGQGLQGQLEYSHFYGRKNMSLIHAEVFECRFEKGFFINVFEDDRKSKQVGTSEVGETTLTQRIKNLEWRENYRSECYGKVFDFEKSRECW